MSGGGGGGSGSSAPGGEETADLNVFVSRHLYTCKRVTRPLPPRDVVPPAPGGRTVIRNATKVSTDVRSNHWKIYPLIVTALYIVMLKEVLNLWLF